MIILYFLYNYNINVLYLIFKQNISYVKLRIIFFSRAWRANVFLLYPHSTALEDEDISCVIAAGGCVCVCVHTCLCIYVLYFGVHGVRDLDRSLMSCVCELFEFDTVRVISLCW